VALLVAYGLAAVVFLIYVYLARRTRQIEKDTA